MPDIVTFSGTGIPNMLGLAFKVYICSFRLFHLNGCCFNLETHPQVIICPRKSHLWIVYPSNYYWFFSAGPRINAFAPNAPAFRCKSRPTFIITSASTSSKICTLEILPTTSNFASGGSLYIAKYSSAFTF